MQSGRQSGRQPVSQAIRHSVPPDENDEGEMMMLMQRVERDEARVCAYVHGYKRRS